MKWPYRSRVGENGDTIYERKSFFTWCFFFFPHSWNWGWYPYANVASARNRQVKELNKLRDKYMTALEKWAEREAFVQKEGEFVRGRGFNHLGVGPVEYLTKKEVGDMYPFVGNVKPLFRQLVFKHVIDKVLRDAGCKDPEDKDSNKREKPDVIHTTEDGVDSVDPDAAHHVVAWRANNKEGRDKGQQGNKKQKKGGQMGALKNVFKKDQDETNEDWEERLQKIIDEEN